MIDEFETQKMTLGEHFEELRRRLIRAIVGIAVGMALCLLFGDRIMELINWPLAAAQRAAGMPVRLRTLSPAEALYTYLKVCLIWGAVLASPYGLWQIWQFIAAGLYPRERGYVSRIVPMSVVLFLLGVAFFYVIIAPVCLRYFLVFGQESFIRPPTSSLVLPSADSPHPASAPTTTPSGTEAGGGHEVPAIPVLAADPPNPREGQIWMNSRDGGVHTFLNGKKWTLELSQGSFLQAEPTLEYYMSFVSMCSLMFGLGFQMPIVVIVLARTGLVSVKRMKSLRKYVIFGLVVVTGIVTPDPTFLSQIALAAPMYVLFELGLLLARRKGNSPEPSTQDAA